MQKIHLNLAVMEKKRNHIYSLQNKCQIVEIQQSCYSWNCKSLFNPPNICPPYDMQCCAV